MNSQIGIANTFKTTLLYLLTRKVTPSASALRDLDYVVVKANGSIGRGGAVGSLRLCALLISHATLRVEKHESPSLLQTFLTPKTSGSIERLVDFLNFQKSSIAKICQFRGNFGPSVLKRSDIYASLKKADAQLGSGEPGPPPPPRRARSPSRCAAPRHHAASRTRNRNSSRPTK